MWAEELYSLRTGRMRDPTTGDVSRVSFGTVRQLRSAASYYATIDLLNSTGIHLHLDTNQHLLSHQGRATDSALMTYFTKGLRTRLGDDSNPATALLQRHIVGLDRYFEAGYHAATAAHRCRWALAGFANLIFWMGWLRSSEGFSLQWRDVDIRRPLRAPTLDIPPNTGVVLLRLLPETKSDRTTTVDVVLSYNSASGLSVGKWADRAYHVCGPTPHHASDTRHIFTNLDGSLWNSRDFRREFLYPGLTYLQVQGDPFLCSFDHRPGNSIPEKYWSLHCYRRGSRSHVSRRHPPPMRLATQAEVYEHARWRTRRRNEAIDVQYRQWTLFDRVAITLHCM